VKRTLAVLCLVAGLVPGCSSLGTFITSVEEAKAEFRLQVKMACKEALAEHDAEAAKAAPKP